MSPKSKTRKKKHSRRPRVERSPYAPLLAMAAELPSVLAAEMWASESVGSVWLAAWDSEAEDPAESAALELEELLDGFAEAGGPAALAALRGFCGVGEEWLREAATEAADALASSGVPEPAWYDPDARLEFVDARLVTDLFGDLQAVALAFQRGTERTTILFLIQAVLGIHGIQMFNTPGEGLDALLRDMIDSTEGAFRDEIQSLTAARAWELVWPHLDLFFDEEPEEGAHAALFEDEDAEHPAAYVALAHAWISLIEPDDLDEPIELAPPLVEAFLTSPHAQDLPDRDAARIFAEIAAESAVDEGRDPDQYGPMSLSALLLAEFAMTRHVSDSDMALFPEIVRAWAFFTSDHRGLPADEAKAKWDEMLPLVLADFEHAYREPEMAAERTLSFRSS